MPSKRAKTLPQKTMHTSRQPKTRLADSTDESTLEQDITRETVLEIFKEAQQRVFRPGAGFHTIGLTTDEALYSNTYSGDELALANTFEEDTPVKVPLQHLKAGKRTR